MALHRAAFRGVLRPTLSGGQHADFPSADSSQDVSQAVAPRLRPTVRTLRPVDCGSGSSSGVGHRFMSRRHYSPLTGFVRRRGPIGRENDMPTSLPIRPAARWDRLPLVCIACALASCAIEIFDPDTIDVEAALFDQELSSRIITAPAPLSDAAISLHGRR